MVKIGYDKEASNEMDSRYFVYNEEDREIIYKGSYTECLVIVGAMSLDPDITLIEIQNKTNGFIFV